MTNQTKMDEVVRLLHSVAVELESQTNSSYTILKQKLALEKLEQLRKADQ